MVYSLKIIQTLITSVYFVCPDLPGRAFSVCRSGLQFKNHALFWSIYLISRRFCLLWHCSVCQHGNRQSARANCLLAIHWPVFPYFSFSVSHRVAIADYRCLSRTIAVYRGLSRSYRVIAIAWLSLSIADYRI